MSLAVADGPVIVARTFAKGSATCSDPVRCSRRPRGSGGATWG